MNCLQHMNNYLIIIAIFIFSGCTDNDDFDWKYSTEVRFINETNYIIRTTDISCEVPDIPANDIIVYEHVQFHSGTNKSDKPNLDNIELFVPCNFFYGDSFKCEEGINNIENQENREQTGELAFKFTFRFTEERFQKAEECQ